MFKQRKIRGLMAAAAYDDLSEAERRELAGYLRRHPAAQADVDALRALTARIPKTAINEPEVDLAGRLRERLAAEHATAGAGRRWARPALVWRGAVATAGLAVIVAAAYMAMQNAPSGFEPGVSEVASTAPDSPLGQVLESARGQVDAGQYLPAVSTLSEAIETYPKDAAALEARLFLADLYYTHLQWYQEAHETYAALERDYVDPYGAVPRGLELRMRRELLAEAEAADYASVRQLNAAKNSGDFRRIEEVMARYPGRYAAILAAQEMGRMMTESSGATSAVELIEASIARCQDPAAIASLKLELAHVHRRLNNDDWARVIYEEVSNNPNTVLAQFARDSLDRMGAAVSR